MPSPNLALVTQQASEAGFRISMLTVGRFRLVMPSTSYGYQGSLDGCLAYLQGWRESTAFQKHKW